MAEESIDLRLGRLEARAEIAELLTRYTFLIDDHEFDALGELFAPDDRFGSPGSTRSPSSSSCRKPCAFTQPATRPRSSDGSLAD